MVQATLTKATLTTPAATDHTDHGAGTSSLGRWPPRPPALAGGQGDWVPALWWGCAVVGTGVAGWLFARRRRRARWLFYGTGGAGVLVVLFFFFGALSPLLPASF